MSEHDKPVAWGVFEDGNIHDNFYTPGEAEHMAYLKGPHAVVKPLYTRPAQWSSLTDDEIKEIIGVLGDWGPTPIKGYTRWLFDKIDAALKEKNT